MYYRYHIEEQMLKGETEEFGKGFSETNIRSFRKFYLIFSDLQIQQTVSAKSQKVKSQMMSNQYLTAIQQTASAILNNQIGQALPARLSWSHHERLIRVEDEKARNWYLKEASEQMWAVRTLDRNINTQYYERM